MGGDDLTLTFTLANRQLKIMNGKHEDKEEKEGEKGKYSYCKVCKINQNQGRRHNYFPNHIKSLSSFLSRFLSKLQHLNFFLSNPSSSPPQFRFWCVFCDTDLNTDSACGNAINHLASSDHLKNLKSFMWKYGGKMDQVDSFRVSERDLAKWEKKCKSLNSGAASEGSGRPLIGPSNDIHNELNYECVDSNRNNNDRFGNLSFSNCVMPLQYHTNERYQVCNSELVGASCNAASSDLSVKTNSSGRMKHKQSLFHNDNRWAGNGFYSNGEAHADRRVVDEGSCLQGLQNLTQISPVVQGNEGNVHSGAPAPWIDSSEESLLDVEHKSKSRLRNNASSLQKSGKIQKLNPKRVGAAWAEKRKIELELEQRGDIVANNFDNNWLPNFGSVWQSGTRKESEKEFNAENKYPLKSVLLSETLVELQPYVSKRKRKNTGYDS